jgi:hypothetical protein
MPAKLTTTVSKIALVPNQTNAAIIEEFRAYMKARGSSEQHQNNNLKVAIAYANFLGPDIQIPSLDIAINVELGTSNIYGNVREALNSFSKVIVCSDEKQVLMPFLPE